MLTVALGPRSTVPCGHPRGGGSQASRPNQKRALPCAHVAAGLSSRGRSLLGFCLAVRGSLVGRCLAWGQAGWVQISASPVPAVSPQGGCSTSLSSHVQGGAEDSSCLRLGVKMGQSGVPALPSDVRLQSSTFATWYHGRSWVKGAGSSL